MALPGSDFYRRNLGGLDTSRFRRYIRHETERRPDYVLNVLSNQSSFTFNGAQIRVNEEKGGFGIFATRDIAKDEIVLTETPYVSYADNASRSRCSHCTKPTKNGVLCSCGEVYCSEQCRQKASVEYHAALCNTSYRKIEEKIQLHGRSSSSRQTMLMVRLLARALLEKPPQKKYSSPLDLAPFHILHRPTDMKSPAELEDPDCFVNIRQPIDTYMTIDFNFNENIPSLYTNTNPRIDMDTIVQMSQALTANSYGMDGSISKIALLIGGSFFNHDCSPNTMMTANTATGNTFYFKTKINVKRGQELTVTYVDPNEEYEMRSTKLLGFYGFNCRCKKCTMCLMQR